MDTDRADTARYLALVGNWVPGHDGYDNQVFANWWWVDNEGRVMKLTPPAGVTVLGMASGWIVGYGARLPDHVARRRRLDGVTASFLRENARRAFNLG